MAWTIWSVPTARRTELDQVLHDDLVSRQSQKLRDALTLGGPAGALYVLVEGDPAAIARADELLTPIGSRLDASAARELLDRLHAEDDAASAGMGLFFTEE